MSKKFTLETLTEGIRQRHQGEQNAHLTEKWSRTGLLRGLDGVHRENMATLLENQAGQVLREASTLGGGGLSPAASSGDIRGFTNIAFPIVRRVFGGLVANELVSIQPMSLPSGLLFYLDYTYGTNVGGEVDGIGSATKNTYGSNQSIYNNPAGKGIRSGSLGVGGQYDLAGSGYSRVHSGSNLTMANDADASQMFVLGNGSSQSRDVIAELATSGQDGRFLQYDPQISQLIDEEDGDFFFMTVDLGQLGAQFDVTAVKEAALVLTASTALNTLAGIDNDMVVIPETIQGGAGVYNVRRLNQLVRSSSDLGVIEPAPLASAGEAGVALLMVCSGTTVNSTADFALTHPKTAALSSDDGSTLVVPTFESDFGPAAAASRRW